MMNTARRRIGLVTFDALHTLITPRKPIPVQYSEVFEPYYGKIEPSDMKNSFRTALKQMQQERPAYLHGMQDWWREVIRRTALASGVESHVVSEHLEVVVSRLLTRFSSKEGYKLFPEVSPVLHELRELGIRTAVVSNGDIRMRPVIHDLLPQANTYLSPILLSEEEGIEKPNAEIFNRAVHQVNLSQGRQLMHSQCLHVGDELECDYKGSIKAGFHGLLLRRAGIEGESAHKEDGEDLSDVATIISLSQIVPWIKQYHAQHGVEQ